MSDDVVDLGVVIVVVGLSSTSLESILGESFSIDGCTTIDGFFPIVSNALWVVEGLTLSSFISLVFWGSADSSNGLEITGETLSSSVSLAGLSTKFCLVDVDGSALGVEDFGLLAVTSFSLSSGMESGGRSARKQN